MLRASFRHSARLLRAAARQPLLAAGAACAPPATRIAAAVPLLEPAVAPTTRLAASLLPSCRFLSTREVVEGEVVGEEGGGEEDPGLHTEEDVLDSILGVMRGNPTSLEAQTQALGMLFQFCSSGDRQQMVMNDGDTLDLLAAAMVTFPGEAALQSAALLPLLTLSHFNSDAAFDIAAHKPLRHAVIAAMEAHATDVDVQTQGMLVLRSMMEASGVDDVLTADQQQSLLDGAMRLLGDCPELRVQAPHLWSLTLLLTDNAALTSRALDAGILPLTLAALRAAGDESDAKLSTICTSLLCNIAQAVPHAQEGAMLDEGVPLATAAMAAHETDVELQTDCCLLLATLTAAGGPPVDAVIAAGGLEAVMTALQNHLENPVLCGKAALSLSCFARTDEGRSRLVASGALYMLSAALREHEGSIEVQAAGALALGLAARADGAADRIMAEGTHKLLYSALRTHGEHGWVANTVSSAFASLAIAGGDDVAKQLLESGHIRQLLRLLMMPRDNRTHENVLTAARAAAAVDAVRVLEEGGLDVALSSMRAHVGDSHVQYRAIQLLQQLLTSDSNYVEKRLGVADAHVPLLDALRAHSDVDTVAEPARQLLDRLGRLEWAREQVEAEEAAKLAL